MLYSKVSCNVEQSLSKMYDYGVYSALDIDFNALMTITNKGRSKVDGQRLYSDLYEEADVDAVTHQLLEEQKEDIVGLDYTRMFSCIYKGHRVDVVLSPVRYYENYFVYSVLGKRESSWGKTELRIIDFITRVTYENVLLDKRVMVERSYLKNLFDSVDSYIMTVDQNMEIISINKKISQELGLDEQCIGSPFLELMRKDLPKELEPLAKQVLDMCRHVMAGAKQGPVEWETTFPEVSKKMYFNLAVSPVFNGDSIINGAIVVVNDISDLKLYEKENEMLRQYAIMGEISADVAHDIKNPLMSIRSTAQLLKKQLPGGDNGKYLTAIIQSADRINNIIEQMLSYSRISTEVEAGYVNINSVLEECTHALTLSRDADRITVRKFFADDLPQINVSMLKLQQLFMNILINAAQAIHGEGRIDVITQTDNSTKEAVIMIRDTGEGMKDVNAAFEMFYTTKNGGTGLGLSIVKKIIDEIGGHCTVKSEEHKGTVFYIRIPFTSEKM